MNTPLLRILFSLALFLPMLATAQLIVTVLPPKVIAQKTVVELQMTNDLPHTIESARAICFLLDDQGKMVGQASHWVVGGTKDRPLLLPKNGTTFSFVITTPQPLMATNLTARVAFTRLILAGGKVADPKTDTIINPSQKH